MKLTIIIFILSTIFLCTILSSKYIPQYSKNRNGIQYNVQDSIYMAQFIDQTIKYDIPEGKDLAKTFLTLTIAVLVASITFSEKIIQFPTADKNKKTYIVASWTYFLLSIILCGVGIGELMYSEGAVVHQSLYLQTFDPSNFRNYNMHHFIHPIFYAAKFMLSAGFAFIIGLLMLMITAFSARR